MCYIQFLQYVYPNPVSGTWSQIVPTGTPKRYAVYIVDKIEKYGIWFDHGHGVFEHLRRPSEDPAHTLCHRGQFGFNIGKVPCPIKLTRIIVHIPTVTDLISALILGIAYTNRIDPYAQTTPPDKETS